MGIGIGTDDDAVARATGDRALGRAKKWTEAGIEPRSRIGYSGQARYEDEDRAEDGAGDEDGDEAEYGDEAGDPAPAPAPACEVSR